MDIDHALSDGPSNLLIVRELKELLHSRKLPSISQLGSFRDHRPPVNRSKSLVYWQEHLRNLTLYRPWGTPPYTPSVDLRTILFNIDIAEGSLKFCRKLQITSSTLICLIWALVFYEISCSFNVAFGYLVSRRDPALDDMDQVMGPLFALWLRCQHGRDHS